MNELRLIDAIQQMQMRRASAPQELGPTLEEIEADQAKWREEELRDRLEKAGAPKRLLGATIRGYATSHQGAQEAASAARSTLDTLLASRGAGAPSLVLHGRPGTGKTHLAVAIMRGVLAAGLTARYTTVSHLARAVRSTYRRGAEQTEYQVLEEHIAPALLVIDEIGVGLGTTHETAMLHDVIAGRYDRMRPTILVSNLGLEEIRAALGERVVDRLREDGAQDVVFDWDSFRGGAR